MSNAMRLRRVGLWRESPAAAYIRGKNPYLWWRLCGCGLGLPDAARHERDGLATAGVTFGRPGLVPSEEDTCAEFDGSSGYAAGVGSAGWDISPDLTVSVVARLDNAAATERPLAGKWISGAGWILSKTSDNRLRAYVDNVGNYDETAALSGWDSPHLYTAVFKMGEAAAADKIVLYRDGAAVADSDSIAGVAITAAARTLRLGYIQATYWEGALDEFVVDDRAWSAAEVALLASLMGF